MQDRDIVIKYKNSERYKCAKKEVKRIIDEIICNNKIYNNSISTMKESLTSSIERVKNREHEYKQSR